MASNEQEELEGTKKAAEETTSALGRMATQMGEFFKVLAGVSEKAAEETKSVSEQMEEAAQKAGLAAGATDDYEKVLKELNKTTSEGTGELSAFQKGLEDALDKATKFNLGLSLINGTLASVKSTFGLMQSMLSGAMATIKGFIGLVDGLWTGLLDAAVDYMNGSSALRQAIENVRKEFGDLATNEGAQVMTMYKELNKTSSTLASTGRSLWNTFGDFAERMQFVTEIATAAGGAMTRFGGAIVKNLPQIALLNKSLNVSNESLLALIKESERAGQDPKEAFDELAVSVAHLSKKFGVSAKMIGKNLDELIKDVETFGHLAPKSLAAVATYAAKLNVEIATLKGLMDTFDTFEGAAQSAGKLNEVLGMQVDTMKMINADNPAERMDMLRKSFEATGKSVSNLSRFELKALSDAMGGMPIEDLKNSLSMSTDDVNFAEIADEAAEAQKKMSPVEAMNELSKNIEKLIKSGELVKGGFFANFIEGVTLGIERSKGFRSLMRYIGRQLKAVLNAGKAVGKTLGPLFSEKGPLGKLISQYKQLIDFSSKGSIGANFLIDIKDAFKSLMKDLETDPKKALTKFFDNLKKAWKKYTKAKSPLVTNIGEGFKNLFIGALEYIRDEVPKMIKDLGETVSAVTEGIGAAFGEGGAVKKIQDPFMLALSEAFTAVFKAVWHHLVGPVIDLAVTLGGILFDYMYPILTKVFLALMIKAIVTAMMQAVVATAVKKVIGAAMIKLGMQVATKNTIINQTIIQGASQQGGVATAVNTAAKGITGSTLGNAFKIAGFMTVMALTFVAAAFLLYKAATKANITKDFTGYLKTFAAIGMVTAATAGLVFTVTAAGEAISKMPKGGLLKGVVALGVALFAIGGLTYALGFIHERVKGLDLSRVLAAVGIMGILVLEAIALMAVAMIAGALIAGPQAMALGTGLLAVGGTLAVLAIAVGPVMMMIASFVKGVNLEAVTKAVNIMGKLVVMAAGLAFTAMGVGLAIGATFGVGGAAIAAGFVAIAGILYSLIDVLAGDKGILESVNKLKITNPEGLKKKMDILGIAVDMMAKLGKIAIDAGKIAKSVGSGWFTSSTTATKNFTTILDSLTKFLNAIKTSIVSTITSLKGMMTSFKDLTPKQMDKMKILGSIISAVGALAGALAKPISELAKAAVDENVDLDGFESKMNTIGNQMERIFNIFAGADGKVGMASIIEKVMTMAQGIKIKKKSELKMLKSKVGIISTTISAIASLSSGLADLMSASRVSTEKNQSGASTGLMGYVSGFETKTNTKSTSFNTDAMTKVFTSVNTLLDKGKIYELVNKVMAQGAQIKPIKKAAIANIKLGYKSLQDYLSVISTSFGDATYKDFESAYTNSTKIATRMQNKKGPVHVIKMLLEDGSKIIKEVNEMTNKVDANLVAQASGIIGIAEKDGKITLAHEKVQVNLSLNVQIETKEIAYALHKGKEGPYFELNQKYQKDPFFTNNN